MNDEELKKINRKLTGIALLLFSITFATVNININEFSLAIFAIIFGLMGIFTALRGTSKD
ncbi:MAG: dolichyl-diphosphooligosaccharide--protein glycosyltransferase subunit 2 [Tolypothrix carrinoi HA7290-LM1]|jgi:hypothetical protein|nr:dolichyl-diphosphooligosaccharide--protein glycosyltransferase subunit 2 [Tolypothrix carrinoi HA7290-LM1]